MSRLPFAVSIACAGSRPGSSPTISINDFFFLLPTTKGSPQSFFPGIHESIYGHDM
jgi:hypothetical protein